MKGIQLYHVQGNGWNDIGYNFLVDRFGTVYEGRFGGVDRNVVGAHAQGFNTGSVGVALLGTYGDAPSKAAQDAIARLLAWRLDLAHVDPTAALTFVSGGSERFASGMPVAPARCFRPSRHRVHGVPGNPAVRALESLAASAGQLGLPKIYEPRVESDEGPRSAFAPGFHPAGRGRSPSRMPGAVEVAGGAGTGRRRLDLGLRRCCRGKLHVVDRHRGLRSLPATGPLRVGGATPPLAIQAAAADPEAITPERRRASRHTAPHLPLDAPGERDRRGRRRGRRDLARPSIASGRGRDSTRSTIDGAFLPDGRYGVVITARTPSGLEVQRIAPLTREQHAGARRRSRRASSPRTETVGTTASPDLLADGACGCPHQDRA